MVVDDVRAQPEVRDVPAPEAPPGGVVVRVLATGLCHSDWHAWAGHEDLVFPHVPGHELAGVVSEVGTGVTRWAVGDRVTTPFVCGCGRCSWCRGGDAQVCPDQQQPGFTHWGSFAQHVALHAADTNLVAVPDDVELATAAALGCRFATAYRALVARARVAADEWVVVVGAGGVGLSAVMIARALDVARRLGADHTLLAGDDVEAAVADITGGGAHVSVDAVGSEATSATALLSLRRRGRLVQVGLLPGVEGHPRVPMERAIAWELDLLGSHGMAASDYPEMMALVAEGRLRPDLLLERTVDLDTAAALLPTFDTATVAGLTIIDPWR
jgi:alcohol dehydrogenase